MGGYSTPTVGASSGSGRLKKSADKRSSDEIRSEVIEQRKASLTFMNDAFYGEWVEAYQSSKARVDPILVKNDAGEWVEDDSRTNVCMTDAFVMQRRKVARLARNPPNMRVRGGRDQAQRDKVSARLMWNWDRTHAQVEFRKVVHCSVALGWGVAKNYWDKAVLQRNWRKYTEKLTREDALRMAGATEEEIQQQLQLLGPALSPEEIEMLITKHGDQVSLDIPSLRYQGPVMEAVFPGDLFPEPGFKSLSLSAFIIENHIEGEDFLEYWLEQKTINPETGQEQPVFNLEACQKLYDEAKPRKWMDEQENSLRRQLREAVGFPDPTTQKTEAAGRKRFLIDERHSLINGRWCVDYIGDEMTYLGRNWYPWNTYGRPIYNELVLIPDMIGGVGDSTTRITRFVRQLRNIRANQTTDFINNKLLPVFKKLRRLDIVAKDMVRTAFGRFLNVDQMNQIELQQDPSFPSEAWQDQAGMVREIQEAEPSSADFNPGSKQVPQAGQLATALQMQRMAADNITADELAQIGEFLRNTFELWIAMDQQTQQDKIRIDPMGIGRIEALSIARGADGEPRIIEVDPVDDLQGELDPMPEEGSTLAADDAYRLKSLEKGIEIGERHPDIVNLRELLTQYFRQLPGIAAEKAIMEQQPAQPPQPNVNVTVPFKDMPPDAQAAFLTKYGLPTTMAHVQGGLKILQEVGKTADALSTIEDPAGSDGEADTGNGNPKRAAKNGSPPKGAPASR